MTGLVSIVVSLISWSGLGTLIWFGQIVGLEIPSNILAFVTVLIFVAAAYSLINIPTCAGAYQKLLAAHGDGKAGFGFVHMALGMAFKKGSINLDHHLSYTILERIATSIGLWGIAIWWGASVAYGNWPYVIATMIIFIDSYITYRDRVKCVKYVKELVGIDPEFVDKLRKEAA